MFHAHEKKNAEIKFYSNFGAVAHELTKVAVRVLSIPTSSATAERNWFTFSFIHDKKRNKLTNDREDIDDSNDDDNDDSDDTVDDSDGNVDNVDNSDIDSDDKNELSVNI
ncbi:8884_t:CDS:2 [Entrophospora sp. SA101]|nr:8882_t:CDS:2 [Entrophospora sp. SA101]CAJ0882342.1 8884_t:CDS:2 [Entrophospora sp. SA101]